MSAKRFIALAAAVCMLAPAARGAKAPATPPAKLAAPEVSSDLAPKGDDEDDGETAIPLLDDGVSQQDQDDELLAKKPAPKASPKDAQSQAPREQAPAPEFPYPGARERAFRPPIPIGEDPAPTPNPELPRPSGITENGEYIWDAAKPAPSEPRNPNLPRPRSMDDANGYEYGPPAKAAIPPNPIPGVERPTEVTASGYHYKLPSTDTGGSWSLRFGIMAPPGIKNLKNDASFGKIYGDSSQGTLLIDREWCIFKSLGHLGLKIGSGLMVASGKGQFVDPAVRSQWTAEENFTFIMFPNTATLVYRFQYADNQTIIPFAEGGAGYYTFTEMRDDDKGPKFGGAAVAVAAGGILIDLSFLDPAAITRLDADYGINRVYLSLEAREVAGLSSTYSFTSTVFNGGIVADF